MKNLLHVIFVISFIFTSAAWSDQTEGLFKKRKKKDQDQNQPAAENYRSSIYNYDYWYPRYIEDYLKLVDESSFTRSSNPAGDPLCQPMFKKSLDKGTLDIRYALGYFDDSTDGVQIVYDGVNYGYSPSLDIEVYYSVREALTKKCEGERRLCGFTESGDPVSGKLTLAKDISLYGQTVKVQLTLTHGSASNNFERNKNELKDRQSFLTLQSEENYFGGLGVADIVFYNGHSRDGGGPDFNPPLLKPDMHVNYSGYYHVKKPGITRALNLIKNGSNKDQVIGFFSCYSQRHFYKSILAANPKQRMILSSDTINYLDSLQASVGYLEGLLRGQCGQNLADIAKQVESVKVGFKGFQIR